MTPADLTAWREAMNITRAEACKRLGIAPNTWTAYAHGRTTIPLYVALACKYLALTENPETISAAPCE